MGKMARLACILLGLCFFSPEGICQEIQTRTIPSALLRPERGESPRYPRDLVIGDLGIGSASAEAYQFAKTILSALIAGAADAPVLAGTGSVITEGLIETIRSIEPRNYRLGGGRTEADGSASFLLRFIGPSESITGELFLRQEKVRAAAVNHDDGEDVDDVEAEAVVVEAEVVVIEVNTAKWVLDGLILEEAISLREIRDSYRYDFTPYERFF